MATEGAGATRSGGEDFHNEDAFLVRDALGLYAVCDGASSGPAGVTAASLAVAAVEDHVARAEAEAGIGGWLAGGVGTERVEAALRHAMRAMLEAARLHRSMSIAVTLLLVRGSRGVIGHVGDSRAYLLRRGRAHALTRDHALALAPVDPAEYDARMEVFSLELEPADRVVLCTDGAAAVVADPVLVRGASEVSPAVLASRIASAAHRCNPDEDATAVVVRLAGDDGRVRPALRESESALRRRVRTR